MFQDRRDAGERLAAVLLPRLAGGDVVVLALPRGGVPVAAAVAAALDAPLDVLGVRKLGAPQQPEFGVGAVSEGGARIVDERAVAALHLDVPVLEAIETREREELARRLAVYRGGRGLPPLAGRTVVVVDDGLATGVTARVACRDVRSHAPARLVLAVPVAARQGVSLLEQEADEVVALAVPDDFRAVGAWYDDFGQTTDDEVLAALAEAADRCVSRRRRRSPR